MEKSVITVVIKAISQAYAETKDLKDNQGTSADYTAEMQSHSNVPQAAGEESLHHYTKMAYRSITLKHHKNFMKTYCLQIPLT